jgi:hypothetical protein
LAFASDPKDSFKAMSMKKNVQNVPPTDSQAATAVVVTPPMAGPTTKEEANAAMLRARADARLWGEIRSVTYAVQSSRMAFGPASACTFYAVYPTGKAEFCHPLYRPLSNKKTQKTGTPGKCLPYLQLSWLVLLRRDFFARLPGFVCTFL